MNQLLVRGLLALGLLVLGGGLYLLVNRYILHRARRNILGLADFYLGKPAILYFTMEGCVPCKTTQRPALELLSEKVADQIQIIEVDVVEQPELADRWGVLSVPTTFIIDSLGRPRRVNHGVALAEKLFEQLEQVSGRKFLKGNGQDKIEICTTPSGMD